MRKKGLKTLIALIFILMLLYIPKNVFAVNDYTITNYDIDMTVNEDNTFDIVEKISVYFNISKHGIYRKIPLKNSVNRLDGTSTSNKAKITNIKVNAEYSVSQENGYKTIKIGSANTTLTGAHTYIIKYRYNIGKDPLKDSDELYYNLIGTEWDTDIEKVNFKISMPKEFDSSSLGFSSGYYSTADSSNVVFSVNGNEISGFTKKELFAGQALTVRLTLPEGYFVEQKESLTFPIIIILLGGICIAISYYIWQKYGKDRNPIPTVEFYPPEGYNSAELEFLYKGTAGNQGIISLLIYLADKGYIKIEETEEKKVFGNSKGVKIYKQKEYDGNNSAEAKFFNGLFKNKDTVTIADLQERFYLTINDIKSQINSKENKEKIFEKKASKLAIIPIIMAIVIFCLITIIPFVSIGETESLIFALVFPGLGLGIMLSMLLNKNTKITVKIFAIFWGILFGGIPLLSFVLPVIIDSPTYLITYIIGIGFMIVLAIFASIIPKRTEYGTDMLGKIMGFKNFLETAEKPKLEALVMENPSYFFNILPYTYALGISSKWIKQFESIAIETPDWYYSTNGFTVYRFERFMNETMRPINQAMTSTPHAESSGSSGGFTGGGFSGGGSGGGGGGSW